MCLICFNDPIPNLLVVLTVALNSPNITWTSTHKQQQSVLYQKNGKSVLLDYTKFSVLIEIYASINSILFGAVLKGFPGTYTKHKAKGKAVLFLAEIVHSKYQNTIMCRFHQEGNLGIIVSQFCR